MKTLQALLNKELVMLLQYLRFLVDMIRHWIS